MTDLVDHARHTAFSDPGRHADLFDELPVEPAALGAVSRNVIVHYRFSGHELPTETRGEVNSRWLEAIIDADQGRNGFPLRETREPTRRVQGCCRDHTLFCVGALRHHGIPARSRVGFAGYFVDGWHHDHVVVEAFLDGRWQRFDPEIEEASAELPTPGDIGSCELGGPGFVTAAQAWVGHRAGEIDPQTYGVGPDVPVFRGERFVFDQVIYEVAHLHGDEMLLWDWWGRIGEPGEPVSDDDAVWLDEVAALVLAADDGDEALGRGLTSRYRRDPDLRPGPTVWQASPFGDPPVEIDLRARPSER